MKRTILGVLVGLSIALLFAFTVEFQPSKTTAEVNQEQGLYIFTDSKPVLEYEYLGTISSSGAFGGSQYADVKQRLIKKCKKDFPQADGIIFYFKDGSADKADAIKFK